MIYQQAFDHIFAPVDEYHMYALRNAALCGVLAFAFLIVGVNQLITLAIYILVIALICVFAWLYSLAPDVRVQVVDRVRDVFKAFWRKCVDESFGEGASDETTSLRKTVLQDIPPRRRNSDSEMLARSGRVSGEKSSGPCRERGSSLSADTATEIAGSSFRLSERELKEIDVLSEEFTSLFK